MIKSDILSAGVKYIPLSSKQGFKSHSMRSSRVFKTVVRDWEVIDGLNGIVLCTLSQYTKEKRDLRILCGLTKQVYAGHIVAVCLSLD